MLSDQMLFRIRAAQLTIARSDGQRPRYGEDIFAGGDYPRTWEEFVGQDAAVAYLQATIRSAKMRGTRLDHVLLASGMAGVGKTTLAKLIAAQMGVGIVEVSGVVTVDEARSALRLMADGDILFWDEFHLAVAGGKAKAEWLLPLAIDGDLVTAKGREPMPKVTIVAATTDAQRLPVTILSRFMVRPVLEAYTDSEALLIATRLAARTQLDPLPERAVLAAVANAGNNAPREMQALLVALRDTWYLTEPGSYDLTTAMSWAGVTADGLNRLAQDYLIALLCLCDGKASLATLAGLLDEPGPLHHTEQVLQRRGYLHIESTGRRLTEAGAARTVTLLRERGMLEEAS